MKKGITINGKHSYRDFGIEIGERTISIPKPNRITESVPYQNGEYDFSNIFGEVTYANRKLTYKFDIAELYTEDMELKKSDILNWISNIVDFKIYDDYDPNYYFLGSLDSVSWSEDFGQGTLSIDFSVYPYKFAKNETIVTYEIDGELEINLITKSCHYIIPTVESNAPFIIERNDVSIAISEGKYYDSNFSLLQENQFKIIGTGTISFRYFDEVL